MTKQFVHLHTHTSYSLLDGLSSPAVLAARAKELGMPALGITDHGNMHGIIQFYIACKKEGIKPLLGVEAYLSPRTMNDKEHGIDNFMSHIILYAKNNIGYKNLCKLTSDAYTKGFYYKPRIDIDNLIKHKEGIIILSACVKGIIGRKLTEGEESAINEIKKYKDLFNEDFYLEIQYHPEIPYQDTLNKFLIEQSEKLGVKLVATNDIHYSLKEDADAHDTLLCIQTNKLKTDLNRLKIDCDLSMVTPEDMYKNLIENACINTLEVMEKCNVELQMGKNIMPKFCDDDSKKLKEECIIGLHNRYGFTKPETDEQNKIIDRMKYEIDIIEKMGFASYFLIVEDFVKWSKSQEMATGLARGSCAGSLVAYLLCITEIDPLKYGLYFERFLNPSRMGDPILDIEELSFENFEKNILSNIDINKLTM